jgi:hypothetical protein
VVSKSGCRSGQCFLGGASQGGLGDHAAGPRVAQDERDLLGAEHEVDRDEDRAEPGGGEGEQHVLPAVVAEQGQPVPLGQAAVGQGVRGPVDGGVELGVADPQVARDDGQLVRVPGGAAVEQVARRVLAGAGDGRVGMRAEHRVHGQLAFRA